MQYHTATFDKAIENAKECGLHDLYFHTIPSGFESNEAMLTFWNDRGYQAELVECSAGYGLLHITW